MRSVPVVHASEREHRRELAFGINTMLDGHTNGAGTLTLSQDVSTVVTDPRVGPDSVIVFMPTNANAATSLTTLYVSSRGKGTFTITHESAEGLTRTVEYGILGTGRST